MVCTRYEVDDILRYLEEGRGREAKAEAERGVPLQPEIAPNKGLVLPRFYGVQSPPRPLLPNCLEQQHILPPV